MPSSTEKVPFVLRRGNAVGVKLLILLQLLINLGLMSAGIWPAAALLEHFGPRVSASWQWAPLLCLAVLVFGYGYLFALLVLRLIIPKLKEGFYPAGEEGRPPKEIILLMINIVLLKARVDPPWSMFLSSLLVRLPPLAKLFTRYFGPKAASLNLGDTTRCLDPYLFEVGRNVILGVGCVVAGHSFDNRGLQVGKVVIEDHAVVGGQTALSPGVRIGHHAVVGTHSFLAPNTVVPPYEYWAGIPAKKIKELRH